ncbi:MobA-like NTP transferase protein [Orenia metallireducens]|uniref:MobA-like NTP transferase domain-containing protein n=1 Tax=Orenia metallireducens TaxID=1413210 RepID=A0A285GZD2_9FIRM|nr:nucleotidyltransferase family protein [Orenia metallireducens]PRX26488.1 MobA-like NTP transferase protein [Orenia metallireducens]SNY28939.1 MobA-like NTP transferase domain-containing protein [Orenia metallireducens]
MGLDAIVLAGAKNNGRLSEISNQDYEALIKVNGKAITEHILDRLREVSLIDNIIVVGPSQLNKSNIDKFIPCQDSLLENLKLGLQTSKSPYSLVFTSDIPLITVEAIEDFLARCEGGKAAFYYPIIPKEFVEISFPKSNRTYFSLNEGTFTGGNIFLVNGDIVLRLEELLEKILKWRKKPWKLAYLLGFTFIIKLLTGKLSIALIEQEVYKLTGYIGKTIISDYPEIGFDIDKPADYKMIEKIYKGSDVKSN